MTVSGNKPLDLHSGILFLISDMGSGGAQQVVSQLANHWSRKGRRVGVLTLAAEDTDFFPLDPGVERLVAGGVAASRSLFQRVMRNVTRIGSIRRALKAFGGETAISFIGPSNILLILASAGLGYRVVISERNDPARQSFGFFWDLLRRQLYRFADIVSANSHGAIDALRFYVPEDKLVYLPNPLRPPPMEAGNTVEREPIVLNVGRLHRQKGQDILIKAFALIAEELPDWRLCIIGEGEERGALESLIGELSLETRVDLAGRIADPFPWYRKAGIFAFPSRWEGTPNALMEAMSCALPSIVSDATPGHGELVRHGVEGLIVPGESPDALAQALRELAEDAALRTRLGRKAKTGVRALNSEAALQAWDKIVWPVTRSGA